MWQSRTSNIPISLNALNTFKQHSRLIHFCHTPLLFLPAWRLQSAATRDHSLTPPQSSHFGLNSNMHEQSSQATQSKQEVTNAIMIKWHQELCKSMLSEYKQYLQILGFNPIQVESSNKTFVGIRHLLDLDVINVYISIRISRYSFLGMKSMCSSNLIILKNPCSAVFCCSKFTCHSHFSS